jgi:hypothetical protein
LRFEVTISIRAGEASVIDRAGGNRSETRQSFRPNTKQASDIGSWRPIWPVVSPNTTLTSDLDAAGSKCCANAPFDDRLFRILKTAEEVIERWWRYVALPAPISNCVKAAPLRLQNPTEKRQIGLAAH